MSNKFSFILITLVLLAPVSNFAQLKKGQIKHVPIKSQIDNYNNFLAQQPDSVNKAKGSGVKPFRRLEWFLESRLLTDDTYPVGALWNAYVDATTMPTNIPSASQAANWTSLGPTNKAGRILDLAFDPNNSQVIWAGSASGGIWRSTDGGNSWTAMDDRLPTLAIGCVVVDPTNSNVIYLGTGEGSFNIDAVDGVGVLKSTDGGFTWTQTGLSWQLAQGLSINEMVINPQNPNVLVAATSDGVYRTADGGTTWTQRLNLTGTRDAKDIVIDPSNPNNLYVTVGYPWGHANNGIYKSTDNGVNWTKLTSGLPSTGTSIGRISLAISSSTPSVLYAGYANTIAAGATLLGIYCSTNAGSSWTRKATSPNMYNGQGWYNNVITVDPANSTIVYSGGVNLYKSTNSGANWTIITNGIHVDFHAIAFNGTTLYAGTDGGVYSSSNTGTTWTNLNNGLVTLQFYKMGSAFNVTNKAMGGTQDNGTNEYSGTSTWPEKLGGDGAEVIYDYTNANIVYAETQNGNHQKSTNGGTSWTAINSGLTTGPWVTPVEMDPSNPVVLYTISNDNLYKTSNGGSSWSLLLDATEALNKDIRVAPSNNQTIYVCGAGAIYKSTNGTSFTKISSGLAATSLTALAVHPTQPQVLYAANGGWTATSHLFRTVDGGTTWQNLTNNLPNVPCNTVVIDPANPEIVYAGTDLGTYVSMDEGATWYSWNDDLPYVVVAELEIQAGSRTIRAATHGRGMYQSNLIDPTPTAPAAPSNLAATAVSNSQINLSWTDNAYNETGFKVEMKTGANDAFSEVATVGAYVSSYSVTGLQGETQYFFRIYAYNGAGNSAYSNEANATTLKDPPAAPNALAATPASDTKINLAWTDNAISEDGFKIERKTTGGTYAVIATLGANSNSYDDTGLTAGVSYYYRVYAYNAGGNSAYSNEALGNTNLALNQTVTASSIYLTYTADKAVDGNAATYWSSAKLGTANKVQTLTVNLGSPQNLARVVVNWYSSYYAKQYNLQVSSDGVNFTKVFTDLAGTGGVDNCAFTAVTAQYVRLEMTTYAKAYYQVTELQVYLGATLPKADREEVAEAIVPATIELHQNYPNPFSASGAFGHPATTISFGLPQRMRVTLKVFNVTGQEVATLADGFLEHGAHHTTFDATGLPTGIYFSVLRADQQTHVRRILLVK